MKQAFNILLLIIIGKSSFGQIRNPIDDGRKIRIPVVFHIVYTDDNENIPDVLINNELHDLNLDFTGGNDKALLDNDFRSIVGNPNIEFYLLDTTLQNSSMKGVRRISQNEVNNRQSLLINPKTCVNVFIAAQGNSSNILSDRINLNYRDVGTHSHVLTHETGHWLGLYHTFGQIGNSGFIPVLFGNHDDLIDDTPLQNRATAICYSITPRCPCPPKNIYYKNHKVLYNSFMDYNPCRCMFSIGQSIKMRNNIIEKKSTLFQSI